MNNVPRLFLYAMAATLFTGCGSTGCATGSSNLTAPTIPAIDARYAPTVYPAKTTLENTPMILDPIQVPPEPDSAINDATLAGVDINHNGIRDDVERWIAKTFATPAERGLMAQAARAFQAQVYLMSGTMTVRDVDIEYLKYLECELSVIPDGNIKTSYVWPRRKNLKSKIYNTNERDKVLVEYSIASSGKIVPDSSEFGITPANACDVPAGGVPK